MVSVCIRSKNLKIKKEKNMLTQRYIHIFIMTLYFTSLSVVNLKMESIHICIYNPFGIRRTSVHPPKKSRLLNLWKDAALSKTCILQSLAINSDQHKNVAKYFVVLESHFETSWITLNTHERIYFDSRHNKNL